MLEVGCDAILVDLRGKERAEPRLVHRSDYGYTQSLGRYLHEQSQNGVLVRSARSDGTNAAILRREALSNPRDLCFLTYRMHPAADRVGVERAPGKTWLEIRPSALY